MCFPTKGSPLETVLHCLSNNTYLVSFLNVTDFLQCWRVVGGELLSTCRLMPFIVNKYLKRKQGEWDGEEKKKKEKPKPKNNADNAKNHKYSSKVLRLFDFHWWQSQACSVSLPGRLFAIQTAFIQTRTWAREQMKKPSCTQLVLSKRKTEDGAHTV